LNELDLQVKALLEKFHATQYPVLSKPLSTMERIASTRQMMNTLSSLRYSSESVLRTEDFDIPAPAGKVPSSDIALSKP
jgi:hypothetical protein